MAQLKFALTFYGGKANAHRVSANRVAEIIQHLGEDIQDVCRIISHEDVNLDFKEIIRGCRLYVVGEPKPSTLTISFETEDVQTEWPEKAGRTLVTGLKMLRMEESDELPKGINRSILEHVQEYYKPVAGEYDGIQLQILANGQPADDLKFDESLKIAAEKKLAVLASPSPYEIEGHSIDGILYGLEDQNYDNPSAKVDVKVDTGDGAHWVCHVERSLLPDDLVEHWKKRVMVTGTAKFRKRKPEMDVAQLEIIGSRPDIEEVLARIEKMTTGIWDDEDLAAYMDRVRERDE